MHDGWISLTELNSYRVEAYAACCLFPATVEELREAMRPAAGQAVHMLGHGCNVILAGKYYDARHRFVCTRRLEPGIVVDGREVRAGAGARLRDVCRAAARAGLSGLERLWDIPGSVGGAAFMNAGAYGASFYDGVVSVAVYEPAADRLGTLSRDDCRPTYRTTAFQGTDVVIVSVRLRLAPGDRAAILAEMGRIGKLRRSRLPYDKPSAGSVFRRPEGAPPVGVIMEEAGLKGFRIGGAQISPRHGGIIVNAGGATGQDILAVVEVMKQAARERYGVELILEQVET
ncbi:MAG: UDP-N-acetylmuramate dehydrogenase [Solidesulfovibrio sp. DCME]|uniref:UDP-N-acetylmuramate dehydrogenase n=1 Tax=Solidesulfovibrio sp. DCME TaxID=3447380 RepID=UPI003D11A464